jgi:alkanesulfonate monooxygenase SsuD/methylene tetrahydromethanopterin reductase-like flavin-dependent oxidoreductase (luciferase family)
LPDHGRKVEFGGNLDPVADFERAATTARAIERTGLEFIGIQDHPYQRRFFDTWTLMSALVPLTTEVHFVTDVANLQLRPAPMLAKAAASLDVISGGRIELGLGAGGFPEAVQAMGGPVRNSAERVDALEEAIRLMRLMWSVPKSVSFDGEHFSLKGHKPGPPPAHRIEIWLGALGPRMLRLTGSVADGWIPSHSYVPPDKAAALNSRIDEAAQAAGRDPGTIRRAYNVMGSIGGDEAPGIAGPPSQWIETLTSLVLDVGMDTFLFWPTTADVVDQFELFGREVVPAVREAVARGR